MPDIAIVTASSPSPETAPMTFDVKRDPSVPELLAPAGGPEAFRAAVANGADAVYLGVETLNARRSAENFTLDSLVGHCRDAHLAGVAVYLTANVVVLPEELQQALDLIDAAWGCGVDAVIIQDLGLIRVVREKLSHVRVHTSTQLNTHNSATIRVLAALGVARVTLSREVSLEEIESFVRLGDIEIESFAHGALCVCYSGQCLMSSLIGGRSANRGQCAQPCRLPYELVDATGTAIETPGAHLLSPRDLAAVAVLDRLVEAGVAAIKIEGRMKSAEYVALVTGVYRAALDRAAVDPQTYQVSDGEQAVLGEAFSRGFSEAYLVGERGNDMMSYMRPNNRGVPVGRVAAVHAGFVTISLDAPLDAEDTIEFWTSAGRFAQETGTLTFDGGAHATAPRGVSATLLVQQAVGVGDRVFRVRNAALTSAAKRSYTDAGPTVPLRFTVRVLEGRPVQVTVADETGRSGEAQGPVVETARTKALSSEEIAEHVGRLGGTPYLAQSWDIELSAGVGIGFSALHRVRREALAAYEAVVLAPWSSRVEVHPQMPRTPRTRKGSQDVAELVVATESHSVARAALQAGAHAVHIPAHLYRDEDRSEPAMVPVLPRILHDREFAGAFGVVRSGARVVAGNLGALSQAAASQAVVEAHWSLNAVNAQTVIQLAELGASRVWLSPELSGRQIAAIASSSPCPVGTAIYGRQEVMVTEHCVLMAQGPCDHVCASCSRRAVSHTLKDRKGYEFPVITDPSGRSHVYNSVPLDLTSSLAELLEAGVSSFRIDLAVETADEAAAVVHMARKALAAAVAGKQLTPVARAGKSTSGHYFRGLT